MMRVTTNRDNGNARHLVEGRITGRARDTLGSLLERDAEGRPQVVDLSGVTYVDPAGLRLLHDLQVGGIALTGASAFVSELLRPDPAGEADPLASPEGTTGDDALLARLRTGEDAAYEELVRRNAPRMLATARRFLRREEDAEDAVQEAFLSAFRALPSFEGGARLSTWLHRIVVNAALMKLRRRRRKPEQAIGDLLPRFNEEGEWIADETAWAAPTDEWITRRETRDLCRECIDRLPESHRTVLVLRDIEDLTTDEVATILDLTRNAVKVRLHRARQALRTLLSRELAKDASAPTRCVRNPCGPTASKAS